jgi:hypothetical protein
MTAIVVHLGEPRYRTACGLLNVKATASRTTAVTCLKCKTTLKYKRALEQEARS